MNSHEPGSTSWGVGHPVLFVLASFPVAGFCGALVTDITYAETANIMWSDFSDWLLAVAMAMAVIASAVWLIDRLMHRHTRAALVPWPAVIGVVLVLILGLFDNLVHSRDAWTSVVPTGLTLSAITVIVMLVTVWLASMPVSRRAVPARYEGAVS